MAITHEYRLDELIGRGGMGEVYRGWDDRLSRAVAIKRIRPDRVQSPEIRRRFVAEARLACTVSHPFMATVLDVVEDGDALLLVMELIDGEPLLEAAEHRRLDLVHRLTLIREVAEALSVLHQHGLVHRDIKPGNILVTHDGHAKLLDLGLADQFNVEGDAFGRVDTELPTRMRITSGGVAGTVAYMSPEQLRGQPLDARSDLFSLGIVAQELLSGTHPFRADSEVDTISAILHDAPRDPNPPDLGAWHQVRPLIARLLAKQPAGRPASADEVVQWIESATEPHLAGAGGMRWRLALDALQRKRWLVLPMLAVLVLTSALVIWLWIRPPPPVGSRSAVAVVPLEDKTSDHSDTSRGALVADLLAVELQGSQLIRCIAPHEVAPLLSGMAKGAGPEEITRRVNTALRVDYTVTGNLYREADQLVAVLNFLPSDRAEPLASIQASGTDAASVATELARGMRASFPRTSLLARWRDQQGAAETFRSSVREANESYARGLDARKDAKLGDSIHWFEAALLADDRFALARGALAEALFAAGYVGRARTEIDRALSDASRNSSATAQSLVLNVQLQRAEIAEHPADVEEVAGRLAQQFPDDPRILMRYARALRATGKAAEAQSLTARALSLDSNNPQLLIWSASLQRGDRNNAQPFELLARAERIYRTVGSLEGVGVVERERGAQFHSQQNFVEARAAYHRAIQDFSAVGQSPLAAGVEVELVKIDLLQGRLSEAQQAIDRIATLASETGNLGLTAQARLNLGAHQMEIGDNGQAESSFLLAVSLARELQDQGLLLNSLLMLSSLFQYTGRGAEARPMLNEVIEFAINDDQRAYADNAKLLLALVDLSDGSFEPAITTLEALGSQGPAPRTIAAHAQESLAAVFQRRGQWAQALTHADQAVAQFQQLELKLSLAYALVVRAEVLTGLARIPEVERDLRAAEQVARDERPAAQDLRERILNARLRLLIRQAHWSQAIALQKGAAHAVTSNIPAVIAERGALLAEAAAATGRGTIALEQAQAALHASRAGVAVLAEAELSLALARRSLGQRELSTAAARTVWQQALRFEFRPLALRAAALLLDPASGLAVEERDVIRRRATEIANALLADCPAQDRAAVDRWPALASLWQALTSVNPRGSTR